MKIAFIHYHLKTGGVTTVIRQQIEALKNMGWQVTVLTGERPTEHFPADVHVIPGLGYQHLLDDKMTAESVVQSILDALTRRWSEGPDIVHVHNPTLAKNRLLQRVLKGLKEAGLRLLCQIHDFAEDGRPGAYFSEPYVPDCHYAVINQRDYHLLIKGGLIKAGCHLIPNPVSASFSNIENSSDDNSPVLYPIRAIRRKNIGEAILLSQFHTPPAALAITQPPNSPSDIAFYLGWKEFVKKHKLPVVFEAGVNSDFIALMASCRYVLTTSITEGFGFAFLEAWLAGKALWGRLLPDICQGFVDAGIGFDHMYERIWIPLEWTDVSDLSRRWRSAMERMVLKFNYPCSHAEIKAAWHIVTEQNRIDFGLLDEYYQQQVIEKLIHEAPARHRLVSLNPFLSHPGPPDNNIQELIDKNASATLRHYRLEKYADRLIHVYTHVANSDVTHCIDKAALLKAFLDPEYFSLLKWGEA